MFLTMAFMSFPFLDQYMPHKVTFLPHSMNKNQKSSCMARISWAAKKPYGNKDTISILEVKIHNWTAASVFPLIQTCFHLQGKLRKRTILITASSQGSSCKGMKAFYVNTHTRMGKRTHIQYTHTYTWKGLETLSPLRLAAEQH